MSRRKIDSRGEKALGVFLDTYFYPKMAELHLLPTAQRIFDKNLQRKGVDVLIGGVTRVDEKAQLYYINRPVESFAFEIDYYDESSDRIVDGWFVEKSNETDAYLLMWIPEARTAQINRLVAEDFEHIDAVLLRKDILKAHIKRWGLYDRTLKKDALMMREKSIERLRINDDCHMTYSVKGYSERPINLVIRRSVLYELSDNIFEIRKDDVKVVR